MLRVYSIITENKKLKSLIALPAIVKDLTDIDS
jgi:hypothetical protein